jgi:histidyl-tRNA synthetase
MLLPGFRDFYPDDCATRNYIITQWRTVARRYGFVEYDGPVVESIDLYRKKSGGELVGQLFDFVDKGARAVALRPEMTPTLARMVAARERDFRKPLKWFSVGRFFRYEKQQRGRLREFYQLNCDIIGENSPAADAECIALLVDLLRQFGFNDDDFVVRISNRNAWSSFLDDEGASAERLSDFLEVIDKMERADPETTREKLKTLGVSLEAVTRFLQTPAAEHKSFAEVRANLEARELGKYVEFDLKIVRGLAYYTGFVFEVFDRRKKLRALAGGGRYDKLLALMSDDRVELPALGFAMGDVVLSELMHETPAAQSRLQNALAANRPAQIYLIIAKEERRLNALRDVQRLRDAGYTVDFSLVAAKVGKQFQTAEQIGARFAVLYGDEWPQVKIKTLATREEVLLPAEQLLDHLAARASR